MSRQGPLCLLTCMAAMAVASMAFNIDEANPKIYKGEEEDFFGYKVLQFISGKEKGVMVSAPYQKNGSGGICRCAQDRTNCTDCYTPQETDTIKYIGLSMVAQSTSPPTFTACSPGLAHECDGNSYLNSICYQFNSQLQITSNFTPAFQECTKKIVDLVFLFDGSASMTTEEFDENKGFINNIMTTLKNSSIKFAAVQFSTNTKTVFNFRDYQEGRALTKLWKEEHMADLTNTHKAIDFVLKNIFENQAAGATADATKVLVIITDGNPSDTDKRFNSINRSDEKNIIRFVIGEYSNTFHPWIEVHFQIVSLEVHRGANILAYGRFDYCNHNIPIFISIAHRSRPVLSVSAHLHFYPAEISTDRFDCLAKEIISPMITLTACFNMAEATKSKAEVLSAGMNVSYLLDVDPVSQRSRAFYNDTNKGARRLLSTVELRKERTCFNHSVYMTQCVIDTLSPIIIQLLFSQSESQQKGLTAILNTDSPTQAVVEVPFEKNCKENETCVAELEVDFNFITSTLLVVDQSYFNVTIRLSNHGDDSFNTSLTLLYPPGLSFSMMHLLKSTRRTVFSCGGLEGEMDRTTCSVSLPVYRSKTTAVFTSKFHILNTYDWKDTMEMTVIGLSDNGNSTNSSLTRTIPVQFAVDLVAKALPQDSTTYMNCTLEDTSPKRLVNVYEVENLGFKSVPITVTFTFPTKLEHKFEMKDYQISVLQNHTQCGKIINSTTEYCSPEKYCKSIECESFLLEKFLTVTFVLSGNVSFKDLDQHARSLSLPKKFTWERETVNFISFVKLSYDKKRYVQTVSDPRDNSSSFHQTQIDVQAELIIPPHRNLIIGTGVGVGLFLLIIITMSMYMLGCFKRKRPVDNAQEDEKEGEQREQELQPESGAVESNLLLDESQTENNGFPISEVVGEGPKEKQDVSVRSRLME
ncbi:integrin alpha-L-like [Oncorhynchus masou masou]|uniref:integrin alpha-L-like n=1 Tax=Oncorhynchus masou masou TaxID=90313 RepID=UPI0031837692